MVKMVTPIFISTTKQDADSFPHSWFSGGVTFATIINCFNCNWELSALDNSSTKKHCRLLVCDAAALLDLSQGS